MRYCTAFRDQAETRAELARAPCERSNADPAGRTEIEELRAAGLVVRSAENALRPGIAAVTARLRTGRLRVLRSGCPQLFTEARLYRYPGPDERATEGEDPVDRHNHALGALRYLVCGLDSHFLARLRRPGAPPRPTPPPSPDENLWTPVS